MFQKQVIQDTSEKELLGQLFEKEEFKCGVLILHSGESSAEDEIIQDVQNHVIQGTVVLHMSNDYFRILQLSVNKYILFNITMIFKYIFFN